MPPWLAFRLPVDEDVHAFLPASLKGSVLLAPLRQEGVGHTERQTNEVSTGCSPNFCPTESRKAWSLGSRSGRGCIARCL